MHIRRERRRGRCKELALAMGSRLEVWVYPCSLGKWPKQRCEAN